MVNPGIELSDHREKTEYSNIYSHIKVIQFELVDKKPLCNSYA